MAKKAFMQLVRLSMTAAVGMAFFGTIGWLILFLGFMKEWEIVFGLVPALLVLGVGSLLMWMDVGSFAPASYRFRLASLVGLIAFVVVLLTYKLVHTTPAIAQPIMALTGAELSEVSIQWAFFIGYIGIGFAVGLARRSWLLGLFCGLGALAGSFGAMYLLNVSNAKLVGPWILRLWQIGLILGFGFGLGIAVVIMIADAVRAKRYKQETNFGSITH